MSTKATLTQVQSVLASIKSGAPMDEVNVAFRDLSVTERNEVRKAVKAEMSAAIDALDLTSAATWNQADKGLDGSSAPAPKVTDHGSIVAEALATLAAALVAVEAYAAEHEVDVTTVSPTVADEDRVTKVTGLLIRTPRGTYTGPRRSVRAHLESFIESHEAGFYTFAQVAGHTSETYGEDHPSSGAVRAHVEAASFDLDGVTLGTSDKGTQGIVLA